MPPTTIKHKTHFGEGKDRTYVGIRRVRTVIAPAVCEKIAELLSCRLDPDEMDGREYWKVTPEMVKVDLLPINEGNSLHMPDIYVVVIAHPFRARQGREEEYSRELGDAIASLPVVPNGTTMEIDCILPPFGCSVRVVDKTTI